MLPPSCDLAVIGAGPAGLFAAINAHKPGRRIIVIEKMPTPAIKLRISGKGRCNITNSADVDEFISHFGRNGRFLRHAFAEFLNTDLLRFFEDLGISFKLERGGRYFPQCDRATEIADALLHRLSSLDIPVVTRTEVTGISTSPEGGFSIQVKGRKTGGNETSALHASKVILATGGKSYPGTGSTGDGYTFAASLGHTITPLAPSLVPLVTKGGTAKKLQGLSLRNVTANIWCDGRKTASEFGEMLFTDFGVSGPIILSLSRLAVPLLDEKKKVSLIIDLKPALEHETVKNRLLREIAAHGKRQVPALLKELLPRKMIPVFIEILGIPPDRQSNQLRAGEQKRLRMLLKEFPLDVIGYRSFESAIVTSGGVSTKEINPRTMESRLVRGLYFAGEIIDIDADTGGYNLQAAFSTAHLAAQSI